MNRYILRCDPCAETFDPAEHQYNCPYCAENLDVLFDYRALARSLDPGRITGSPDFSIWRYAALLPAERPAGTCSPIHQVGWTPVYDLPQLAARTGREQLMVKDESRNPTASFKDRASAVVVAHALEAGVRTMVTASSGNAGAALAGMAAAAGVEAVILVPKNAPAAKVAQLVVFGARVFLVDGSYDDAFDLALEASAAFGWYNRNTGYNPLTREGKKTAAFEIWEQAPGSFDAGGRPLNVFVSVGDGNIISGIHKGFQDLAALGWIERIPRLFGVQAEGAAAVAEAFQSGSSEIRPVRADTLADSIRVDLPRDGRRALQAAIESGGAYITVTDTEILAAIRDLGSAGVFAEPAGAAAFSGLKVAVHRGLVSPDEDVLVFNTGSGLKDIAAAQMAVEAPPVIEPDLEDLKRNLAKTVTLDTG
ncbi:MAG TPA: threonine synthase [Anaerolineales bacterium]|nr:threonine synthase [Anaerolineales bacterium]